MKTYFSLFIILGSSIISNVYAQCAGITPPIDLGPDIVGCTGDVITLDAGAGYDYYWWSTSTGDQTINVTATGTYGVTVMNVSNTNLVYNGDFQQGNTGFYTDYSVGTGGPYGQLSDPGTYAVDDMASDVHDYFDDCFDHTGVDFEFPLGKMLIVNGSTDINAKIWCQTISVNPWMSYQFSSWVSSPDGDANVAQLQYSVNGVNFGAISSPQAIACNWTQFTENWYSNTSTTAEICIVNMNPIGGGNDFMLDDISFMPICSEYDEINVTLYDQPVITASADETICSGETVTLSASSVDMGLTYTWEPGTIVAQSIDVSPSSNSSYTVSATNAGGCTSNVETINVTVAPDPVVNIGGLTSICSGESTTLTASSDILNTDFVWSTAETTTSITVSPTSQTIYTLTGTTQEGCSGQTTHTIDVTPALSISITGNPSICSGQSETYTAVGNTGSMIYSWSPIPSTDPSITIASGNDGTYTVTGSDPGCSGTVSESITVTTLTSPVVTVDPLVEVCEGSTVDVTATADQSPVTFYWDAGAMTGATQTLDPATATSYTVYAENTDGCVSSTETVNLNVNTLPILGITGNLTICEGDQTTLTANSDIGGTNYTWSTTETTTSIDVTPTSTTIYTLIGETPAGCSAQVDETVTVQEPISISIEGNLNVCSGQSTTLTVNGNYTGMTYLWSPTNEITASISVSSASTGVYGVTANNGVCASVYEEVTVTFVAKPLVTVIDSVQICAGELATLTAATDVPSATLVWSPNGLIGATQVFGPTESTLYYVYADNNGCLSEQDSVMIIVNSACQLVVPNVFTPNEDGNNDKFFIIGSELIDDINCVIVNRWGDPVAQYDTAKFEWDGKSQSGVDVSDGVYFYHITGRLLNGEEFDLQGFVELFR